MSKILCILFQGTFIFFEIFIVSISSVKGVLMAYQIQENNISIMGTLPVSHRKQKNITFPVYLQIPKIQINTTIIPVGLTPQGTMSMPQGFSDVGWFNSGIYPGNIGTAVIAGHYGILKNGTISVFNNLSQLKKGDTISVIDKNGTSITFVVRESRIYLQNADTSSVFISDDRKAHLNLITCHGIWNKVSKSYPNRLVIFTDKVE